MKRTEESSKTSKEKPCRKAAQKKPPESAPDGGGLSGDWSAVKALLQERKEKGLADRVETQTRIISGDLVLRDVLSLAVGNIYATDRTQVLVLDESTGHLIGSLLGIPENENHNVRKIMGDLAYDMMRKEKEGMLAFIETMPGE
jgi:hypothetical protein